MTTIAWDGRTLAADTRSTSGGHYGKSAREAVELACIYDVYTSTPVTEIHWDAQGALIAFPLSA